MARVPSLDNDDKLPDKFLPERLSDANLESAVDAKVDPLRDLSDATFANNLSASFAAKEGGTIGGTTSAISIRTKEIAGTGNVTLASAAPSPWINHTQTYLGTTAGAVGQYNYIGLVDQVDSQGKYLSGLKLVINRQAPAKGLREAIQGRVNINGDGGTPIDEAQFVGVHGHVTSNANIGGTAGSPIGSIWGSWSLAELTAGATNHYSMQGIEVDITAKAGSSVENKIGVSLVHSDGDAVNGTVTNAGLIFYDSIAATSKWTTGIQFGRAGGSWPFPFDNNSVLIGVAQGLTVTATAKRGIDFTGITFADAAIMLPGAAGIYSGSGSPNSAVTGSPGSIYVRTAGGVGKTLYVKESGTGNTGWVATSAPLYGRRTSDRVITNSASLTADDQIVIPVEANAVYEVTGFLDYNATTTADMQFGWTVPAGSSLGWTIDGPSSASSSASVSVLRNRGNSGTAFTVGGIGSRMTARPVGLLTVSTTAGNLVLTAAQGSAEASDATLYAGSYVKLTRIS